MGAPDAGAPVPDAPVSERFFMQSARAGAIVSVFAMVLIVETGVLHLVLSVRHPLLAWILTVSSVSVLAWLLADYVALGRSSLDVGPDGLAGRIGRRVRLAVPPDRIASAIQPQWRDVSGLGEGYVNATKPATPNVLLTFREPVEIQLLGMARRVVRIGIRLDRPEAFVEALGRTR